MKLLTKDPLKKLLYAYLVALILVVFYYLIKQIIYTPKEIDYKHFNTASDTLTKEGANEQTTIEKSKFLLLPKK